MKTITIHTDPQYWGSAAKQSEVYDYIAEMEASAVAAGFEFFEQEADGTTDAAAVYSFGDYDPDQAAEEIDWFKRFCAHGFDGMTEWIKTQIQ